MKLKKKKKMEQQNTQFLGRNRSLPVINLILHVTWAIWAITINTIIQESERHSVDCIL